MPGDTSVSRTLVAAGLACLLSAVALAGPVEAGQGLLGRLLPDRAGEFLVEAIPQQDGLDVFELESIDGKIILRGSTGVSIASALNHYLGHYANADISLYGINLDLPQSLPPVPEKVRIASPFKYRYCFNYCCFSYSLAWYDWAQWERIIDWMALHGINMPLAITGQEATWQAVYRELGLSDEELAEFFVGPAFLPFGWMGCIDGWCGPLPQHWIDEHRLLQEKILAREREFGMTPVLQGFTGHVPPALREHFPGAAFEQLPSWCGFPGTVFINPQDPLFQRIGGLFIEKQTAMYGTDHLYASDTFIEMSPPSDEPAFLEAMGEAVYQGMVRGDPEGVWVMQGWIFINNPDFWKPPQAHALFNAVPNDHMILLDLHCEARPAWTLTEAFGGKPWIWSIIQSFGDQVSLHGGLPAIVNNLNEALESSEQGALCGMGLIMEGLGYNPVVYDLMGELMWQPGPRKLAPWCEAYADRRYGQPLEKARQAWRLLLDTAYQYPGQISSIICGRPTLESCAHHAGKPYPYHPDDLTRAWTLLLDCADELAASDTYQYDLVHITRQVLSNLAAHLHSQIGPAYQAKNLASFRFACWQFSAIMRELDRLLATRPEFLLGRWLEDAKRWASCPEERRLLEWNARTQITLWGPPEGILHDYAHKQWAGLIKDFYLPRWELFFDSLEKAMLEDQPFDEEAFGRDVRAFEEDWTHQTRIYADEPRGFAIPTVRNIWRKHRDLFKTVEPLSQNAQEESP